MNKVILENVKPMDEMRMDCDDHALYPIISYMGNDIDYFILNSFHRYILAEGNALISQKIELGLYEALGYSFESKTTNSDFINYLKSKINNNQPLYVMCDLFALPRFKSPDKDAHAYHAICVFGYDDEEKKFHIIDHKYHDSFLYIKQEISYDELYNASMSCEKHLNNALIITLHKHMDKENRNGNPIETYKNYYLQYDRAIETGFKNILLYWDTLKEMLIHDEPEKAKEFIRATHSQIGNIMNKKIYEQSVIKKHFPCEQLIIKAENRVFYINYIYAVMVKYIMKPPGSYEIHSVLEEKFNLFYQCEVELHNEMKQLVI